MAFIRIKKIKNYEYAYLVENTWKKKTSRQKVKEYLGRVVKLDEADIPYKENIGRMEFVEAVESIIEWQFTRLGFEETEKGMEHEDYFYDQKKHTIVSKRLKKPVVIKSHDGYLSKHAIKKLLNFKPEGTEEEIAYDLARSFVECGIFVDKELFIELFQKVYDVKKAMHR